jgi:superfamily II DNA or RNA helicase
MLRPTASEALFLQQVGRIMRPSEGKTECYLLDHVGNVGAMIDGEFKRKHGLPNEIREWTLDGRQKKKGKKKDEDEPSIPVKQCPKCFLVHEPSPACPGCGHVYPVGGRSLEQVDGELHKITPEMVSQMKQEQRRAQGKAQTVEQMVEQLGYSRGRAEKVVKAREEKAAMVASLMSDLQEWHAETGQTALGTFGVPMAAIRNLKPKQLKELRERFDNHRSNFRTGLGLSDPNVSGEAAMF